MKYNPTISIIVPIYNAEAYLKKCIESILKQSYTDIEVILVNDGSKDNSGEICDDFVGKDTRVKVIHKKNEGVSSARNIGIDTSNGKYICFIDSDDWVDTTYLSSFMESQIKEKPELFILHDVLKENINSCQKFCNFPNETYDAAHLHQLFADTQLAWCGFPYSKLYISKIIKAENIRFDHAVHYGEDFLFMLEYMKYIRGAKTSSKAEYHYINLNENSLVRSHHPFESEYRCFSRALDLIEQLTEIHNLTEEAQKKLQIRLGQLSDRAINSLYRPKYSKSRKERLQILKDFRNKGYTSCLSEYVRSKKSKIFFLAIFVFKHNSINLFDLYMHSAFYLRYKFQVIWLVVRKYLR